MTNADSQHSLPLATYDASVDSRVTTEMKTRADESLEQARIDVRERLQEIFRVAIDSCETLEELFKLQDLAISLNGLLLEVKGTKNG